VLGQPFDPAALRESNYIPVTALVRATRFVQVGGFPEPNSEDWPHPDCEDWALWLRLLDAGAKFSHLPERTWTWEWHGRNTSGRPDRVERYYGEHPAEPMGGEIGEGQRDAMARAREKAADLKERAGEFASQAGERVRETTGQVRERASRYMDRTGSQLRQIKSTARHRSRQLWSEGGRLLSDYPLEATGVFFAVGVFAGLLIPSTRREDELLGDVRDDVVERAKETGRETIEKLQNVGQETLETAKGAMEREGLAERGTVEKAQDTASKAFDQARSTAGKTADQAKGSAGKAAEAGRSTAQAWDPTRTGSEGQNKPGNITSGKDKGSKGQTEHDIKIKKE